MPRPTIIVHGGAGSIQPYIWSRFLEHAQLAARCGQAILDDGGSAVDAAMAASRFMEDDETFNAGTGSALNREGMVECDALVMTSERHAGAVAGVRGIRNPIDLARIVMEHTDHLLIVGPGAMALARQHGIELCNPAEMVTERRLKRYLQMKEQGVTFETNPEREATDDPIDDPPADDTTGDTVGACALDEQGNLAVTSTTGGMIMKLPGRAGDVPVIGGGSYCGPAGAVTCSGHGEPVVRVCLAKYAYDLLEHGAGAQETAERAVDYLVAAVAGNAGLIVLDRFGNRAWATSTRRISVGVPEGLTEDRQGFRPAPSP